MKVVAKHICSVVNESRAQQCGCNKTDALRTEKYWGYMIKKNRDKTIEELSEASKVSSNTCLTVMTIVVHSCRNMSGHALMGRPAARLETMVLVKRSYVVVCVVRKRR